MRNVQVRAANEFRTVQEKIMINFVYSMGKIFNICRHDDLFLLVLG